MPKIDGRPLPTAVPEPCQRRSVMVGAVWDVYGGVDEEIGGLEEDAGAGVGVDK
jgi:hypothetical protein